MALDVVGCIGPLGPAAQLALSQRRARGRYRPAQSCTSSWVHSRLDSASFISPRSTSTRSSSSASPSCCCRSAASWKPVEVAWGVIAFWLLLAVQASSMVMKRLPRRLWKWIHLGSYVLLPLGSCARHHRRHRRWVDLVSADQWWPHQSPRVPHRVASVEGPWLAHDRRGVELSTKQARYPADGPVTSCTTSLDPVVRILVVEDELPMADSLRRGLEAEGFASRRSPRRHRRSCTSRGRYCIRRHRPRPDAAGYERLPRLSDAPRGSPSGLRS